MADYWDQYQIALTPDQALGTQDRSLSGQTSTGTAPTMAPATTSTQALPQNVARWQQRALQSVDPAVRQWSATAGGTQPTTTVAQTPASKDAVLKFIADWQGSHPATRDSFQQLSSALQSQFGVGRFDYNGTPSNNEFLINGEKVKVMGGEDSATPSWFAYGSDDGWRPDGGMPNGFSTTGANGLASFSAPGLLAPYTQEFHARNPQEIANDPAYQFQLQQGTQAMGRSKAAKGNLLTGGTLRDAAIFGQGLASTFNDKYYDRDINEYQMNRGTYWGNQTNAFGRLSDFSQQGLNAAGQMNNAGGSYADRAQTGANNLGNLYTGMGNANGAANIAGANATNRAGASLADSLSSIDWSRLFKRSGGTPGITNPVGYDENL